MQLRIFFILPPLVFLVSYLQAQSGLWTVEKVTVGEQIMTPTAKWFHLRPDGQTLSGNGGMINAWGSWEQKENEILFFDAQKSPDEYGAFEITVDGETMSWRREEEGMDVLVSLRLTTEYPKAPWDLLVGRWNLTRLEVSGEQAQMVEYAEGEEPRLFFRWDRLYRGAKINEQLDLRSGVWQYHAHRPVLRLLSEAGDQFDQTFTVGRIDENTLVLESLDMDTGIRLSLSR